MLEESPIGRLCGAAVGVTPQRTLDQAAALTKKGANLSLSQLALTPALYRVGMGVCLTKDPSL